MWDIFFQLFPHARRELREETHFSISIHSKTRTHTHWRKQFSNYESLRQRFLLASHFPLVSLFILINNLHLPAAENFFSFHSPFDFSCFLGAKMAAFARKSFRIPQVPEFKGTAEFRKNALIPLFMSRHLALDSAVEDREPPRSIHLAVALSTSVRRRSFLVAGASCLV